MDIALGPGALIEMVQVSERGRSLNTTTSMIVFTHVWLVIFICEAQRQIPFTRNVFDLVRRPQR